MVLLHCECNVTFIQNGQLSIKRDAPLPVHTRAPCSSSAAGFCVAQPFVIAAFVPGCSAVDDLQSPEEAAGHNEPNHCCSVRPPLVTGRDTWQSNAWGDIE